MEVYVPKLHEYDENLHTQSAYDKRRLHMSGCHAHFMYWRNDALNM